MWLLGFFFCSAFISWMLGVYVVRYRYARLGYAGPMPWPFIGNIAELHRNMIQDAYTMLAAKFGKVFVFMIGIDPVIIVNDCETAREICIKRFRQFHDRPDQTPPTAPQREDVIRSGMLLARGHLWTSLRAAAQPVFHAESLSQYAQTMNTAADGMLAVVQAHCDSGGELNMAKLAGQVTMKVVMKCAFGVDTETHKADGEHKAISAAKQFFAQSAMRNPWMILIVSLPLALRPAARRIVWWLADLSRMERARDVMFGIFNLLAVNYAKGQGMRPFVVDKAVLGKGDVVIPPDSMPSKNSIVAAMMHAKNRVTNAPLDPSQLIGQGSVFMAAGYETTAAAVSFCTYLLATNAEAEKKLLAEVDAQGRDARPAYEDLDSWPYAKACFREALRIYPIGSILIREALEGTTVAGRWVPKGTAMHINVWGMHHDPQYFPEPEAFRPERFIEAAAAGNPDLHPAYMPFGLGPHNCIGWRFAMEEGVILLIRLYQKYIFRLSDARHPGGAMPIKTTVTVGPKDGVWVNAIAR